MDVKQRIIYLSSCAAVLLLSACGGSQFVPERSPIPSMELSPERSAAKEKRLEVTFFALGLIDIGYRFGGKNPEAGLDCSGMVSYIYDKAAGLKIKGNAADIARQGRSVERSRLRPGDLVFFNTRNASFSHVGLYIGDERFIHAPKTNGQVRIEQMSNRYFAQRFEAARTYLD